MEQEHATENNMIFFNIVCLWRTSVKYGIVDQRDCPVNKNYLYVRETTILAWSILYLSTFMKINMFYSWTKIRESHTHTNCLSWATMLQDLPSQGNLILKASNKPNQFFLLTVHPQNMVNPDLQCNLYYYIVKRKLAFSEPKKLL